jgi:sulfatase maturation enzyme AslB (radical SAM superfamily)
MERPDKLPNSFCTAPWVHAYYDSTGQRFPCSIVHIHEQFDRHRWDVQRPLEEWINCNEQKNMRRDMLKGKMLRECDNCNINFAEQRRVEKVYKDYWNDNYIDFVDEIYEKTSEDGTTTFEPISFDYRTNIKCNFKCRMCTPFQSSAIYDEAIENNMSDEVIEYYNKDKLSDIDWIAKKKYEEEILNKEFIQAAQSGRLVDINFAGGEPLLLPIHWEVLDTLIKSNNAKKVELRYQSNLSVIEYKGKALKDLAKKFYRCYFQASIDAGGPAGEYLRTGLKWSKWQRNYTTLHNAWKGDENRIILPQMAVSIFSIFGFDELFEYLAEKQIDTIDIQIVCASPKILLLSPYTLPPEIKEEWIQYYFNKLNHWKNLLHPNVVDHFNRFGLHVQKTKHVPGGTSYWEQSSSIQKKYRKDSYIYLKKYDDIRGTDMNNFLKNIPSLQKWFNEIRDDK